MLKKLLSGIIFSLVMMMAVCGFSQTFNTSDLEGTWYTYLSETNPAVGTYWVYGNFTVDNSGGITGGSYTAPDGTTVSVTGGRMSVDNNGIITGTITAEGDVTGTFPNGKLDQSKTIASFVGYDTNGSLDLGVAIKAGGSFSTSDLEGTWYTYLSETNPAVGTYWVYGNFTVDNSGGITGGSYTAPDGTTVSVTGGRMSVDNNGIITGTITAEGDVTGTFPNGKLDQSKTIASFVGYDTNGSLDLGVAIKAGGSFSTSDLEGTWYTYLSETNPAVGTYWVYGNFTVDNSGGITGGSYTAPDGTTVSVTGGQMSVDNNGIITGTITSEGDVTGTFPNGKLDQSKTIASFVGADTNGSLDLGVAIKLKAAGYSQVQGNITYNGTPLCAMVLANGQYMFSCEENQGKYELDVPLDENGEITLFAFVDGLAPFKQILTPLEALDFDIEMELAGPDSKMPTVTRTVPESVDDPPGWVKFSGFVSLDGTPLCAMVLANGQYMFSCDPYGEYQLSVPLDSNGEITLFVFVDGLQPYKEIISP